MIRILQVVYQMDRGGAETWLMHVLRHIDRSRFQMDFLVHTSEPCAYDGEIRDLGGRIFPAPHPSKIWAYDRYVAHVLKQYGPYAAVHSHCVHFSGHVLRIAARLRVPLRIVHSHNTRFPQRSGLLRKMYAHFTRPWIARYATQGLACSAAAARALFGENWTDDPRWKLLPCSLDFAAFSSCPRTREVRAELGIPQDAWVAGHVGRFDEQKNHTYLVEVGKELIGRDPQMHLLLVGDGPLRPRIEHQVAEAGLQNRVTFAGVRADVPRLMLGAMDLFLFPSLWEGLGLVLVEAQAAGLPCICSDVVPPEADLVPELIRRVPLSQGAASWAKAVRETSARRIPIAREDALAKVMQSTFNIANTIEDLERVYSSAASGTAALK